ncbi:beta-mannanase [Paenibacillus sp.]|jgi:hypothetical protein|uniref:beta-mannanase n=1 Tax=Paenibacillus sp. TaxID=58172 RepID=UPI002835F9D3|nr:beta-mannanase [Paenibacillus sp.]MDR0271618.1 beta-mannanase [Paenibacillus sp.]
MRFIDADISSLLIRGVTHQLDGDRCILRWRWPEDITAVYIERSIAGEEPMPDAKRPNMSRLKLYTRNEYKASNGYHDRIDGVGKVVYTIYASTETEDGPALIRQHDGHNRKEFSTGKAKVWFSIRQKSGWLQKYKSVQIKVTTEISIPKEALCYVKKEGSYPANKDDGTQYPFVTDFEAGRNVLPVIEVGKNDYVRLFFTDGKRYGQMYELVPET